MIIEEDRHVLKPSLNIVRVRGMRRAGGEACLGELIIAYKVLVGKTEGKKPHDRHGHRREDCIKIFKKK
jgi:hypothetical protein